MTTTQPEIKQPTNTAWYSRSAEDVLAHVGSSATGLSAQETAQRLAADGPNDLKEGKRISSLQIFFGQFKSLIIWILIVAGALSTVFLVGIAVVAVVIAGVLWFVLKLSGQGDGNDLSPRRELRT